MSSLHIQNASNFEQAASCISRTGSKTVTERCAQGHALQLTAAETGKCEECSRWLFGGVKVMFCGCCKTHYCSVCCPQARSEDALWDDIVSTLGGALRDVERVKSQVANDIDVDFQRFRAALDCQNPGNQTLSAEVIVVEHAVEQAKVMFTSCQAPDRSDLESQEVVVGSASGHLESSDHHSHRDRLPVPPQTETLVEVNEAKNTLEQFQTVGVDLLDLSDAATDVASTEETLVEVNEAKNTLEQFQTVGVDLLDLSDAAPDVASTDVSNDLVDLSMVAHDGNASKQAELLPSNEVSIDLLDFPQPGVTQEVRCAQATTSPQPAESMEHHSTSGLESEQMQLLFISERTPSPGSNQTDQQVHLLGVPEVTPVPAVLDPTPSHDRELIDLLDLSPCRPTSLVK